VSRYTLTLKPVNKQGTRVVLVADAGIWVYALVVIIKKAGAVCKNRDKQLTHIVRVMGSFILIFPFRSLYPDCDQRDLEAVCKTSYI